MAFIIDPTAADFLSKEATFVYDLYHAAELEVRLTERYVLLALGGIYSYLATTAAKEIPIRFRRLAWYAPTFVVVFAGFRALGLGFRQKEITEWLLRAEYSAHIAKPAGWAQSTVCGFPIMAATASVFYIVLTVTTGFLAHRMSRSDSDFRRRRRRAIRWRGAST
ncbi:MAG TPA: hypothetical protein VNN25_22365 [Thermoanaerobaculia bacterium]|nr:hypothetical protein [Thermoanaerobaculia bacterium]